MISQAFLQVNNIACAIFYKILLNIAVGYCRIECTAAAMMLKPTYSLAFIIFTCDVSFIYYSKMFNAIIIAITATSFAAMITMHYFNIAQPYLGPEIFGIVLLL